MTSPPQHLCVALVAPGEKLTEFGEVGGGAAGVDGEQAGAQLVHLVAVFGLAHHGDLDLGGVAADVGAVLPEDAEFAFQGFRVGEAVPDVRVLGREAERLLLASLPIRTGMSRVGFGFNFSQRDSMRGSAVAGAAVEVRCGPACRS